MLRPLAAVGGLLMLSMMKDLPPAALLTAPLNFDTLATRIWTANEGGFLADAGIASLVLIAMSALLTWLLVIRHVDHLR
jgi:iron(III) transport system permease protein